MSRSADIIFTSARVCTSHATKFFMDVVWESYTVLTLEPYADDPTTLGPRAFIQRSTSRAAESFMRLTREHPRIVIFVRPNSSGRSRKKASPLNFTPFRRIQKDSP